MTREEAITELNVIYERLSHTEDCEWIVNNLDEKCSFGNYDIHPQ